MRLLDIHSHILPGVDDGSKDTETSVELLKVMKQQGITDVVATPHFDAMSQNIDDFKYGISEARREVQNAADGLDLPRIFLGSEVYYFKGIGKSAGIRALTLGGSDYLLLELPERHLEISILKDITDLTDNLGLVPILAHIERYHAQRGFKDLLKLITSGGVYAQVNAFSVIEPPYKKITQKLIRQGYISFIATDTHSLRMRPPLMAAALDEIEKVFGKDYREMFIHNTGLLYQEITNKEKAAGVSDEK